MLDRERERQLEQPDRQTHRERVVRERERERTDRQTDRHIERGLLERELEQTDRQTVTAKAENRAQRQADSQKQNRFDGWDSERDIHGVCGGRIERHCDQKPRGGGGGGGGGGVQGERGKQERETSLRRGPVG